MENNTDTRSWHEKKRYYIPASLAAVSLIAIWLGGASEPKVQSAQVVTPIVQTVTPQESEKTVTAEKKSAPEPDLSNDDYYTNTRGNSVHSPAYADSVPSGASAECRDGTYSFSQSRSGTCSHHGGVSQWL